MSYSKNSLILLTTWLYYRFIDSMFRFLNLLLLLSFFPTLYSTEIITLEPGTKKINLGKLVYYYEDQKNELTFDTVSSLEFEKKFIQNHTEIFSFGFNPYTYWLRLDFENLDSKEMNWLLEIGYSHLDTIDFYFQKDNVWQKQKYGDLLPFSKREIFSRFFVIPIEISKQVKNRLYIKIKTSTVVIVPLNLYKPTTYIESNMKQEGWYAFFYGAMFVMILYNGFVYLAFRDNSYLLYCLSTFFTLFFYLSFNGHGFQYLWKENIWLQNHSVPIFTGIA